MSGPMAFQIMPMAFLAATAAAFLAATNAQQTNISRLRHSPTGEGTKDAAVMARAPVKRRSSSEATFESPAHAAGMAKK